MNNKNPEQIPTKEDIQVANKYMKRSSVLCHSNLHIKTAVNYYYTSVRAAHIQNINFPMLARMWNNRNANSSLLVKFERQFDSFFKG